MSLREKTGEAKKDQGISVREREQIENVPAIDTVTFDGELQPVATSYRKS
jgi:hypothetical protein